MKQNQNGFSHVIVFALIALVIGTIGLTGYRINQQDTQLSTTKVTSNDKKTPLVKAVATPAEKLAQPANTTTTAPTKSTSPPPSSTPSKPVANAQNTPAPAVVNTQKRTISFTKGGGGQQDTVVRVSANLSETQQGICTYKFSLDGSVRVEKTSAVSNSNQCFLDIPITAFPKSATYSFSLSFVSGDGLVSATQSAYDIEVK